MAGCGGFKCHRYVLIAAAEAKETGNVEMKENERPYEKALGSLLESIKAQEKAIALLERRNKELEEENEKLKQMLKKVADDAEGLFMGFAGYNPYEKRLKHEDCEAREYCDYCDRDCDCDGQCKWRYEGDVKKLLGLE